MKKVILFMAGILASMMLNAQSRWSVTPEAGLVVNKENEGTSVTLGFKGEFYQFNLSSCIRQQNSLTAQFVSFSLANLANIFYPPPDFYNN